MACQTATALPIDEHGELRKGQAERQKSMADHERAMSDPNHAAKYLKHFEKDPKGGKQRGTKNVKQIVQTVIREQKDFFLLPMFCRRYQ